MTLDPNEVAAMKNNPNTRRFQNFMSKVITSVRTRTQNNALDQSDAMLPEKSQALALPQSRHQSDYIVDDFTKTRPIEADLMKLSGQISGHQSSEMQNLVTSLTPANIRASARREIGLSEGGAGSSKDFNNSQNQIMRVKTQSQSGFNFSSSTHQPRAAE